jgi:hypothetical protein
MALSYGAEEACVRRRGWYEHIITIIEGIVMMYQDVRVSSPYFRSVLIVPTRSPSVQALFSHPPGAQMTAALRLNPAQPD